MENKNFKWIVVVCAITMVACVTVWRLPEILKESGKDDATKSDISEYVYIDNRGNIHANRKCPRLNYKGMSSKRLRIDGSDLIDASGCCPKCVDDECYKELIRNPSITFDE